MKCITCVLVLFCTHDFHFGNAEYTESNISIFPEIYNITDAETCPNGYMYCILHIKLRPQDELNPSELWKTMKKGIESDLPLYNRDIIYRTICVEKNGLKQEYNEYNSYGLEGWIERSYCFEKKPIEKLSNPFKYFVFGIVCYLAFMGYCTIKANNLDQSRGEHSSQRSNNFIKLFSITNTWREITRQNNSEKFDKLLFIQGIRVLTMCLIIMTHNLLTSSGSFSHNPEYIEKLLQYPMLPFLSSISTLDVQIFFIISAWLLAIKLNNIVEKNGKITILDIFIILLNRLFRLMPALIVVILLHSTISDEVAEFHYRSLIQVERDRCRNGWWRNLLFVHNWSVFGGEYCSPATWYLAVDTQLYILTLLSFYLSRNFRFSLKYILGVIAAVAVCLQGYTVLTTNFDGLLRGHPRLLPLEMFFIRPEFIISYTGTLGNLATYVIGFVGGTIYVKNKNEEFFNTPVRKVLWCTASLGLPLTSAMLQDYRLSTSIEVLMAITLRPLFSLGITIGILGMATNVGGNVRKFLQWRPLSLVGNFTYSVYMFNFSVIFHRLMQKSHMIHHSFALLMTNLVIDLVSSFLIGTLMYIILEHPCTHIQKMLLPEVQIKKSIKKSKVY